MEKTQVYPEAPLTPPPSDPPGQAPDPAQGKCPGHRLAVSRYCRVSNPVTRGESDGT